MSDKEAGMSGGHIGHTRGNVTVLAPSPQPGSLMLCPDFSRSLSALEPRVYWQLSFTGLDPSFPVEQGAVSFRILG